MKIQYDICSLRFPKNTDVHTIKWLVSISWKFFSVFEFCADERKTLSMVRTILRSNHSEIRTKIVGSGINEILSVNPWPFWWHVTENSVKEDYSNDQLYSLRESVCQLTLVNPKWNSNPNKIHQWRFTKWFMNIFIAKIEVMSDLRKMWIFFTNISVTSTKTKDTNNVTTNRNWSYQIDFNGLEIIASFRNKVYFIEIYNWFESFSMRI